MFLDNVAIAIAILIIAAEAISRLPKGGPPG